MSNKSTTESNTADSESDATNKKIKTSTGTGNSDSETVPTSHDTTDVSTLKDPQEKCKSNDSESRAEVQGFENPQFVTCNQEKIDAESRTEFAARTLPDSEPKSAEEQINIHQKICDEGKNSVSTDRTAQSSCKVKDNIAATQESPNQRTADVNDQSAVAGKGLDTARDNVNNDQKVAGQYGTFNDDDSAPAENSPEGDTSDENKEKPRDSLLNFCRMSFKKKLTVVCYCISGYMFALFISLLGPFFPQEAGKKGVSPSTVGFIFSCYQLVAMIFAPICGAFISKIGSKFMYVMGLVIAGYCSILFGFLEWCPDGTVYVVLCFLVRSVEAVGGACLNTASFAILGNAFPDSLAMILGSLELFFGLGLMTGPPIGGFLYQLGGFKLPFISAGSVLLVVAAIVAKVLPKQEDKEQDQPGSYFTLLTIPIVAIVTLFPLMSSLAIGLIDVTLGLFLESEYKLQPGTIGVVFLVSSGVYAIGSPLFGILADKKPKTCKPIMTVFFLFASAAFLLIGPAPFLPIPRGMFWLVMVSQVLWGIGLSTMLLSTPVMLEAMLKRGFTESIDTFGLIGGLESSIFAFGALVGPLAGGFLTEKVGFPMTAAILGCTIAIAPVMLMLYQVITASSCRGSNNTNSDPEREPLMK